MRHSRTHRLASTLVAVVVVGLGVAPAASGVSGAAEGGFDVSGPDCASAAVTDQEAAALAAACDQAVEVVGARTE